MFPASTTTETRLALLEEKMEIYENMMKRIDAAIEKISETSQTISKMLAIHNERIEHCVKLDDNILKMIEEVKKDAKTQHDEIEIRISERISKVETKVDELAKFRWIIGGAVIIISFMFSQSSVVVDMLTPDPEPARIESTK